MTSPQPSQEQIQEALYRERERERSGHAFTENLCTKSDGNCLRKHTGQPRDINAIALGAEAGLELVEEGDLLHAAGPFPDMARHMAEGYLRVVPRR